MDGHRSTGALVFDGRMIYAYLVAVTFSSPFLCCVQTAIAAGAPISLGCLCFLLLSLLFRCVLREWLTPDYFNQITQPPEFVIILISIKGELLCHRETIEIAAANLLKSLLGEDEALL
jgi:hypothetical protein